MQMAECSMRNALYTQNSGYFSCIYYIYLHFFIFSYLCFLKILPIHQNNLQLVCTENPEKLTSEFCVWYNLICAVSSISTNISGTMQYVHPISHAKHSDSLQCAMALNNSNQAQQQEHFSYYMFQTRFKHTVT